MQRMMTHFDCKTTLSSCVSSRCAGGSGAGRERERADRVCLNLPEVGVRVGGCGGKEQGLNNITMCFHHRECGGLGEKNEEFIT